MISVYRNDQQKRFAPFSYLNHSFILNVTIYISFIVFLQISLAFFVKNYVAWEVWALASHLQVFCFQSEGGGVKSLRTRGGGGLKYFRTGGGVTDFSGVLLLRGSVLHYTPWQILWYLVGLKFFLDLQYIIQTKVF